MVGEKLGHYRILDRIGAGGMGVVYRARDERLERDVALKVLTADALSDEPARRRFRKEALALSKLNHPHIAAVYDFDSQQGTAFLVMEYVTGRTLAERVSKGPLPEKEVVALGAQIAEALAEAHEAGVVHRDLKPGNIMVTAKGQAKVLDFGLAKLSRPVSEEATTEALSDAQAVVGTVPYMAPEQLRGERVDERSDVYAAGAVLYEMATGQRPFPGARGPGLIAAILKDVPTAPSALNRRVSPSLEGVILKALDKEPERRYQSARELRVDLERLSAPAVATAPPARASRRRLPLTVTAGLAAVPVLAASIYLLVRGRDEAIDSLAVLPFVNASGDPDAEYLSDGITESLINSLSQLPDLKVISRTSVFRYKGREVDPRTLGRDLKVRAVLSGRLLQRRDRLLISAELVDARDGRQIWGEQYNRGPSDMLVLQEELAREISGRLRLRLTGEERKRLDKRHTQNTEAHQLYLRGRYSVSRFTPDGFQRAIEYYKQAIAIDPAYALPHAGLAQAYTVASFFGLPPSEGLREAKKAVERALEIDEGLGAAHGTRGTIKMYYDWDWTGAEAEYRRALELSPGDAEVRNWYGWYLSLMERFDEGLAELERGRELDPVSPTINTAIGVNFYWRRQHDRAVEHYRAMLELDPGYSMARQLLAEAYEQQGRFAEALAELRRVVGESGDPVALAALAHACARSGKTDEALLILDQLRQQSMQRYVPAYLIALIHAGLDEKDAAFEWLERAYAERSTWMAWLRVEPRLDPLRADARFASLLRRVGLR